MVYIQKKSLRKRKIYLFLVRYSGTELLKPLEFPKG